MCSAIEAKSPAAPPRPGRGLPRASVALLAALAGLVASSPVRADWPMARHDGRRSGAADGKGNIQTPVVGWKSYLGGRLAVAGLLAADVEGNGKNAFIIAAGGSVSAVRPDGTVIWSTPTSGTASLAGARRSRRRRQERGGRVHEPPRDGHRPGDRRHRLGPASGRDGRPRRRAHGRHERGRPTGAGGRGGPRGNGYKTQTGFIYSFAERVREPAPRRPPVPGHRRGPAELHGEHERQARRPAAPPGPGHGSSQSDLLSLVDATGTVIASSQPSGRVPLRLHSCGGPRREPRGRGGLFHRLHGRAGAERPQRGLRADAEVGLAAEALVGHPRVAEPGDQPPPSTTSWSTSPATGARRPSSPATTAPRTPSTSSTR